VGRPALASSGVARTFTDGPVVIGSQLYSGGELTIYRVGSGDLLAIEIDGQRIALMFRRQIKSRPGQDDHQLVLHRDDRGFYHLAIRISGESKPLQMAAAARGLGTIPNFRPLRPHDDEAVASR